MVGPRKDGPQARMSLSFSGHFQKTFLGLAKTCWRAGGSFVSTRLGRLAPENRLEQFVPEKWWGREAVEAVPKIRVTPSERFQPGDKEYRNPPVLVRF